MVPFMHKWVTVGILSLLANLSLAAELPQPVTHSKSPDAPFSTILLGRDLFYDPILSGNRTIACASCHTLSARKHALEPAPGTPGAVSAPALYNLGAAEFQSLFHDGRVARDPQARMGIAMPPGAALERPVQSVLAAQALIALIRPEAMAGTPGENAIANLVAKNHIRGLHGAWQRLTERVEAIPAYRRRFTRIIGPDEPLHITDIANALAAFEAYEFRATDSPFDAYLRGRAYALTPPQRRGADLFYGKANCAACHSGPYLTDYALHAAIPHSALSPDEAASIPEAPGDRSPIRTPSLRNVALTAPYGHTGAYASLDALLRHHAQAIPSVADEQAQPANTSIELTDAEIADLIAFLGALTDPASALGRLGPPAHVPSGLPVGHLSLN